MSNKMNLPLTIARYSGGYAIDDAKGQEITGWLAPEHAAHIVKCVNSHDALVEALTIFVQHFGDPFQCARAALTAATGEQHEQ